MPGACFSRFFSSIRRSLSSMPSAARDRTDPKSRQPKRPTATRLGEPRNLCLLVGEHGGQVDPRVGLERRQPDFFAVCLDSFCQRWGRHPTQGSAEVRVGFPAPGAAKRTIRSRPASAIWLCAKSGHATEVRPLRTSDMLAAATGASDALSSRGAGTGSSAAFLRSSVAVASARWWKSCKSTNWRPRHGP